MDLIHVLQLYDRYERRELQLPGIEIEITSRVVRAISQVQSEPSMVIYSSLDESNADDVIRSEIARFAREDRPFEWKAYSHDEPSNLVERLVAAGLRAEEPEDIMVLDLQDIPPALRQPVGPSVRQVTDQAGLDDVMAVQQQVWDKPLDGLARRLAQDLRQIPDMVRFYVAYQEGNPVSSAWMYVTEQSPFASMWGGSTLLAYRRRGLYTELLAARVQEAARQGARFATVDAGPMSRPILQRFKFQRLTVATPCMWPGDPPA